MTIDSTKTAILFLKKVHQFHVQELSSFEDVDFICKHIKKGKYFRLYSNSVRLNQLNREDRLFYMERNIRACVLRQLRKGNVFYKVFWSKTFWGVFDGQSMVTEARSWLKQGGSGRGSKKVAKIKAAYKSRAMVRDAISHGNYDIIPPKRDMYPLHSWDWT